MNWWEIAQSLLYPSRTYASLVKRERFRVSELAIRLCGLPYHNEPPPMDAEFYEILATYIDSFDPDGQYRLPI